MGMSENAAIAPDVIAPILQTLQYLRTADDVIYLRAASLNVFNGKVSLTFSCDGTHYMPCDEFLQKGTTFWFGVAA